MGYEKYYQGGWKSGEAGGTPITPEVLNHMEEGITNALPLSGGTLTGPVRIENGGKAVQMGTASDNVYIHNSKSGNYLQLKDDGTLAYNSKPIYHTGNKPTAEDVGAVPTSREVNGKPLSADISLGDLISVGGTPKSAAVTYSNPGEMGLGLSAPCTTEEFVTALPTHGNVQFMQNASASVRLTDAPESYGMAEFHKGPNNGYIYGLLADIYSNFYFYKHGTDTASNGWKALNSRPIWVNAGSLTSFGSQTLTIPGLAYYGCIAILFTHGSGNVFTHIAHRNVSNSLSVTPTGVRYENNTVYVVQKQITVNFSAKTIQFGMAKQNGVNNQETAIPIAVIGLS